MRMGWMDVGSHLGSRRSGDWGSGGWVRERNLFLGYTYGVSNVLKSFWIDVGGEVWEMKDFL